MKKTLSKKYQLYINGEWKDSSDKTSIISINPATGQELASIANASKKDVDIAVNAARKAFDKWKNTTPKERAKILNLIADIIDKNKEWLATVETLDNGKPIRETLNVDIPLAADHFRYFASAILVEEGTASILDGNKLSINIKEPIGVVAQIIPWNFPFLIAAWKLAPALASGCCVVLKPSSFTSISLLELMKLIEKIIPKGVINIITGEGSKSGEILRTHSGIDKIAFTGSTNVGKDIAIGAATNLIPATLELGGKSANIIFDDADLEKAIDGVQLGILFNQGQVCCAGSRIFVHEKIYDDFLKKIIKKFNEIKVGDPLDKNTQMGSQINKKHLDKILHHIEQGKQEGAKVICGGESFNKGPLSKGAFMKPTLLVNVTNQSCIAQEEIFGPVAVVIKFKDEDEVIKMANDSLYGLGGAVFTKNINRALKVAQAIQSGRIWINTYNQIPEGAPFGGYKKSGIGRETHKIVLNHYTQIKNIMIDLSNKPSGFY